MRNIVTSLNTHVTENAMENVVILPEQKIRELFQEQLEAALQRRIPEIIRRASRKEYITTTELQELTGMSPRMQAYHRENGHLPYSQEGRKIWYKTADVERFFDDRRIEMPQEG